MNVFNAAGCAALLLVDTETTSAAKILRGVFIFNANSDDRVAADASAQLIRIDIDRRENFPKSALIGMF